MRRSKWPAIPDAAGSGGDADTTLNDNFASLSTHVDAIVAAAAPSTAALTDNTSGTVATAVPAFSASYTVAELNNFAATVISAINSLRATLLGVSAIVPLTDSTGGTAGNELKATSGGDEDVVGSVNAILATMRDNGMIEKSPASE